jgi:hypothetical protein
LPEQKRRQHLAKLADEVLDQKLRTSEPTTAPSLPVLKSLSCDIFLGAHGDYFGLEQKYSLMNQSVSNPFVDPKGYKNYIAQKEQDFRAELSRQKVATK